ncbi:MAG TPA: alpha-amylase family glycosyl hydrolase [Verrucomicrobiae bacterium]|nr:alpha-amylase family glycosyl hydrolase [Verrucomicrobiae bacterium]
MRGFYFALVFSLAAAAHAAFSSPEDWRDENIYFIFLDRFYDGDPSNNNVESAHGAPYSPSDAHAIHGGDLKGVQQKLDYIKSLGATAIWITPIPYNVGGSAFHGYGAQDFYTLAPHWGTMTDLSNMVSAAHSRGIKVILDIVCNHSGDLIDSGDSGYPNFLAPPSGYNMRYKNIANQHAPPFNITNATPSAFTSIFHNNGAIQNFGNTQQVVLGELSSLDDFATETTYVRTNMMNIYTNWVGIADLDGFRIDTVKHVDYGFWQYWCPQLHQYATSIGKSNFFMFGEIFDSSEALVGSYTGTMGGGPYKLDSSLDYPLYDTVNSVFATASGNTKQIENHYNAIAANYDTNAWYRLVTFLDNHDNPRFLSPGEANDNTNRLGVALEFLYTSRGIPCLYYGTEQAFDGTTDPNNREDMFAGQFEQGPSLGDNFNETHPLFQLVAKLNNFRRLYQSLRRGVHNNRWNTPGGPGLFAYSRVFSNEEVFVVFNTASSTQTLSNRSTIYPSGTVLVNLLDTNETIMVSALTNTTPQISVPSMTAKIFIAQSLVQPLDPVVISQSPAHAATCISTSASIALQFSKPMDTDSVEAAFSVTPATTGTFTWNTVHDTMTFTPSTAWPVFTTNLAHLATNAVDSVDGNSLYAPFDTYFVTFTTNTITTSSSPAGGGTTSGGGTVNCGSNITVCATPNSCYTFVNWTQNGSLVSTTACYTFFVTSNETLVANFVNALEALATDNAGDPVYGSGWSDGSNGGIGLNPWALTKTSTNANRNGFFLDLSTDNAPHVPPGVDTSGKSWGIYANGSNTAAAYRSFTAGPVQPGGQLLIDMDNGLNDVDGSAVGFTLRNGDATNTPTDYTTGARLQFYLAGGSSDYTVVDATGTYDSGVPLTYTGMHLIFSLGTNDDYTLAVVTGGSSSTNTISGTQGGAPNSTLDSIALFNDDAGAGASHNVFFNSLSVANFTPITYTINTSSSPPGGGSTGGGGVVNCGSNVTVCAVTNACYQFVNWTEGSNVASSSLCYDFMVSGDRDLVANFSQINYTITTSSSPPEGGTTDGGGSKVCGSSVTVNATPNPGYNFVNWTEDGSPVSSSSNYTFTASGNRDLVGNFIITQAPPVASFTANPTLGAAPLLVNFTDTSTGTITNHFWSFGDGNTSTATSPSHSYSTAAVYSVALTVSGPGGSGATNRLNLITVTNTVNTPPTVSIIRPANGMLYPTLTNLTITIVATAMANDGGAISKLEFFADDVKFGETTSNPGTNLLVHPTLGTHTLTVVATDTLLATNRSNPSTITIGAKNSPLGDWEVTISGADKGAQFLTFEDDFSASGYGIRFKTFGLDDVSGHWGLNSKGQLTGPFVEQTGGTTNWTGTLLGMAASLKNVNGAVPTTASGTLHWKGVPATTFPDLSGTWTGTVTVAKTAMAVGYAITSNANDSAVFDIATTGEPGTVVGQMLVTSRNKVYAYVTFDGHQLRLSGVFSAVRRSLTLRGTDETAEKIAVKLFKQ